MWLQKQYFGSFIHETSGPAPPSATDLHGLDGVRVLDDAVAPALVVLVPVELGRHHAPGQAEHLAQLLFVHGVAQLES